VLFRSLSGKVLVLNQSYEPISICSARKAIVLVLLSKADIVIFAAFCNGRLPAAQKELVERFYALNPSMVVAAISSALINEYHGSARPNAHGLSIAFYNLAKIYESSKFLGFSLYDPDYINLGSARINPVGFLDDTSWGSLLDVYYAGRYPDIYPVMRSWKYYGKI
jgi:hypothetical protein